MLARVINTTDLILPAPLLQQMGNPAWFHVTLEEGKLVLTPAWPENPDKVREYIKDIGITPEDVDGAIQWARKS